MRPENLPWQAIGRADVLVSHSPSYCEPQEWIYDHGTNGFPLPIVRPPKNTSDMAWMWRLPCDLFIFEASQIACAMRCLKKGQHRTSRHSYQGILRAQLFPVSCLIGGCPGTVTGIFSTACTVPTAKLTRRVLTDSVPRSLLSAGLSSSDVT